MMEKHLGVPPMDGVNHGPSGSQSRGNDGSMSTRLGRKMLPRARCKSATTSRPHRRICSLPSAIQRERYRILHPNLQPTVCRGGWVEAEVATRMLSPTSTFANTFLAMTRAFSTVAGRWIPLSYYSQNPL